MEYTFDRGVSGKEIMESITNDLDLVKLGLFILNKQTHPIAEGTCILSIIGRSFGDISHRIRRHNEHEHAVSEWQYSKLSAEDLPHLEGIMSVLEGQRDIYGDIKVAIWHFGRACLTPLSRDILLESVIGLEGLLVPGGGDSSYRFNLHGAVLLASDSEKSFVLYKKLDKIYNMRSRAAHGAPTDESLEKAREARIYLSRAIFNISMLCDKGKLPCKDNSGKPLKDMAVSLQKLIITKSSLEDF